MGSFLTKEEELESRIERLEYSIENYNITVDSLEKIAKSIMKLEKEHCGTENGFHVAAGIAVSLVSSAILEEVIKLRRR